MPEALLSRLLVAAFLLLARTSRSAPQVFRLGCIIIQQGERHICVLNISQTSSQPFDLDFEGDIEISAGAQIITSQSARISASGKVSIRAGALLQSNRGITIFAGAHFIASESAVVKATFGDIVVNASSSDIILKDGASIFAAASLQLIAGRVNLSNAKVNAVEAMHMFCRSGTVWLESGTTIGEDKSWLPEVVVEVASFYVQPSTAMFATYIRIKASRRVHFNSSSMKQSVRFSQDPPQRTTLFISTPGELVMGSEQSSWNLARLVAAAGKVLVQGMYLSTLGSSCANKQTGRSDRCAELLSVWSDNESAASQVVDVAATEVNQGANVSFDVAIISSSQLKLSGVNVGGASMLICARNEAVFLSGAGLNAQGRGCGPGEGIGAGESRDPRVECGAGGGSHVGRGGRGAKYSASSLVDCAWSGMPNDILVGGLLPTKGASGGGCGVPRMSCSTIGEKKPLIPSSAGGLVWISAPTVKLGPHSFLSADGSAGIEIPWKDIFGETYQVLSGGGSGGQILIFASDLTAEDGQAVTISASGGAAICTNDAVSGGGGGGFIGLRWVGDVFHALTSSIKIDVSGGELSKDCLPLVPRTSISIVQGEMGVAASLLPCQPGYSGLFCFPCPVGTFNVDGGPVCLGCSNRPSNSASYTTDAWPNSTCPYSCHGVAPNVKRNPNCNDALPFVFHFFGGATGVIVICLGMGFVSMLFFVRHNAKRSTSNLDDVGLVANFSGNAFLPCFLRLFVRVAASQTSPRVRQASHAPAFRGKGLVFTRECLPYHVCRTYLTGRNEFDSPWEAKLDLPSALEELVSSEGWVAFASELNVISLTSNQRMAWVDFLLSSSCPPLAQLWARRRRRRTASKLRDFTVACFAQVAATVQRNPIFWKPLRAQDSSGSLEIAFGCDDGATSAFIDVFDFSLSPFDWAPIDLRRETRLLVAHGHGSYAEPFALDISDPLVQHLAQTQFAPSLICSVVSEFNRCARILTADELRETCTSNCPRVRWLQKQVEQCVEKCGLAGFVRVLVVPMATSDSERMKQQGLRRRGEASSGNCSSFSDLIRGHGQTKVDGGSRVVSATTNSLDPLPPTSTSLRSPELWDHCRFTEPCDRPSRKMPLLGSGTDASLNVEEPRLQMSNQDVMASFVGGGLVESTPGINTTKEIKLCLAFVDCSGPMLHRCPLPESPSSSPRLELSSVVLPTLHIPLTSPMSQSVLREHFKWAKVTSSEGSGPSSHATCSRSWWRSFARLEVGTRSPSAVILVMLVLFFSDLLLLTLAMSMLYTQSLSLACLWWLVPPFAQLGELIAGTAFLISEAPWIGRMLGGFLILGSTCPLLVAIALAIVWPEDSWAFDVLEFATMVVVRLILFVVVHLHIGNLEANRDLGFAHASQAEFLARVNNQFGEANQGLWQQRAATTNEDAAAHECHHAPVSSASAVGFTHTQQKGARSQFAASSRRERRPPSRSEQENALPF